MIRARGTGEDECKAVCSEQDVSRGCFREVNGHTYSMCQECADLDDSCPHGVQEHSHACHAGCAVAKERETCDFEPMVEDLVATHVQNYTALLGPVQEQIVQVRTVVETINEMVSSGGLGVDTMRTTLLSYMRSLVPDAKAAILGEGTKSAGALQGTAAGRLGAVLGTFNSSAAGDASQASADSALSGIPALLDTVKSVGTDAAAFLDGGGSGSPLELALAAVREGVASASGDVLGDLEPDRAGGGNLDEGSDSGGGDEDEGARRVTHRGSQRRRVTRHEERRYPLLGAP